MRIVEVLFRPAVGGAETLVRSLADYWQGEGHEVSVVYLEADSTATSRIARVRRLRSRLERLEPNVVHSHSALPNLYARLSSRGRWPVVTVLHSAANDFADPRFRWSEKMLQPWTAAVISVSESQRRQYTAQISRQRTPILIPNGIRVDLRPRIRPAMRPLSAVAVGRIAAQKRMDLLLEAWRRAALDGWTLQIAGTASEPRLQTAFDRWVAEAGPSVHALGVVRDIPGLLAESDLFVHAADQEGHPLAPLEAAASGLPLVVSEAVARTLPDGLAAGTFSGGNPSSLASALRAVVGQYDQAARAAIRSAPAVRREFSLATCARRHLEVLQHAVRTSKGREPRPD